MRVSNFIKMSTLLVSTSIIASCASLDGGTGFGNAELVLIHTSSSEDPSIPKYEKDKSWLKIKNKSDLVESFEKSGNPNIIYSKDITVSDGLTTKIKDLNSIDLVLKDTNYKNQRELFNANKIELEINQSSIVNKTKEVNIKYRVDLLSEFKTDVMNMEVYPTYQTFNDTSTEKLDKDRYKIISKMVMKDNSNIFMVYKYKK